MTINNILLSQNTILFENLRAIASISDGDNTMLREMSAAFIKQRPEVPAEKVFVDASSSIHMMGSYIYWDDFSAIVLRLPCFFGYDSQGNLAITAYSNSDNSFNIIDYAEEQAKTGNWKELLSLCPEVFQLEYIARYWERMPKDEVYSMFMGVYTTIDYGFSHIDKKAIKGICALKTDEEKKTTAAKTANLPEVVTVYRGSGDGSTSEMEAFSWSTDINIGVFFATRRAESNATVYSGKVRKEDIVELIDDRDESEVFVLPEDVKEVSPAIKMREINNLLLTPEMLEWYHEYRHELELLIERQGFNDAPYGHDGLHMLRVLLYAIVIASEYPEIFEDHDAMDLICTACITHDIGRTNDGVDDNHGAASYRIVDNERYFFAPEELEFLLTYHCLDDSKAARTKFRSNKTIWQLYQILKDADALDRVRFGIRDLDVNMLRCPISKELVLFAVQSISSVTL